MTNILVTGGAGYIGSHNVLALLKKGYNVVIFDNLETGHKEIVDVLTSTNAKGKVIDFVKGDLKNYEDIESVFKIYDIAAVIHFAAYSLVGESVSNPQKYYYNNVFGTLNLLKAMLENNVNMIVFSSSAAVYGEPVTVPMDENHPKNPINPYGKSKLMIENIMDDYDLAYGLKSIRLRYFNVVGADSSCLTGEWHDNETHLIPNILKASLSEEGKVFKLYGSDYDTKDGTCIRDYINVEDLAKAHILSLECLLNGGCTDTFNLGTRSGDSVKEVFKICEEVVFEKIPLVIEPKREGDPVCLVADNTRIRDVLGWCPKTSLKDSITSAYTWEKSLQDKFLKVKN